MWYAECLKNWYNAVGRTFYDAINDNQNIFCYSDSDQKPSAVVFYMKVFLCVSASSVI